MGQITANTHKKLLDVIELLQRQRRYWANEFYQDARIVESEMRRNDEEIEAILGGDHGWRTGD